MAQLGRCSGCRGFLPEGEASCPHCGAAKGTRLARVGKGLLAAAGGGLAAVTLAACYGPPALCTLPDGGSDSCLAPVDAGADAGTLPDGGALADAGPLADGGP